MFEMFVGLKFDEVVEKVAQLDGLFSADQEYGSVWYTPSQYGWESDDTYEFLFEDDVCVGVEGDLYEEDQGLTITPSYAIIKKKQRGKQNELQSICGSWYFRTD